MSEAETDRRVAELERLLNDPETRMDAHRVWALLAELARPAEAARRISGTRLHSCRRPRMRHVGSPALPRKPDVSARASVDREYQRSKIRPLVRGRLDPSVLHRAAIRNSRLPSGPVIGLGSTPSTRQPGSAAHQSRIVAQTSSCTAGSRTTPPLPTRSGPASNCGLISATAKAPGAAQRQRRRQHRAQPDEATRRRPRRRAARAAARRSGGGHWCVPAPPRAGRCAASSRAARARHRRHRPCAAPWVSSTSVKPPVEAPTSTADAPRRDQPEMRPAHAPA